MRERLEQRLRELREEFEKGQQTLEGLEAQAANVRQTLLRYISPRYRWAIAPSSAALNSGSSERGSVVIAAFLP